MKQIIFMIFLLCSLTCFTQPNCYIYPEGSGERKACELSYKAIEYPQGSRASQELFDKAIAIGPKYAWAYYEKSVPYFKRGFLSKGLQILNKAIALEPREYLCYRAYWYWQYKNYRLCINDLERYYKLPKAYLQQTPGGDKDMKLILGLAYAKQGNINKGIEVIEEFVTNTSEDDINLTDYHTLGLLYTLNEQYAEGISMFKKQLRVNADIPDTYYYMGLAYKGLSNRTEAKIKFDMALIKILDESRFKIANPGFRVYESDIREELKSLKLN